MIRFNFIAFAFLVFVMSCQSQKQGNDANYFVLNGKLENADRTNILLQELTTRELLTLDSFYTDASGAFSYRGKTDEAGFFILKVDDDNKITLLIEPGEELYISGDATNLAKHYSVRGSEGSALLATYYRKINLNNERLDSLSEIYNATRHTDGYAEIRDDLKSSYRKLFREQQGYVQQFIKKNPKSLASIIALYQYFGDRLLLNDDKHFAYFESLSLSLSEVNPTNKHVMELNRQVSRLKRSELKRNLLQYDLTVGSIAPEVVLPDPDGNNIALSSLRGKYVLIDFWASWCNPCRKANLELKSIYDQYKDFGFEIYGISLDRTMDQWLQGIEEDGVTWPQVSDLRLWNSPAVSLYGVERIPFALLICPEGRIISNKISTGELEEFLADQFSDRSYLALP
jgi:peroxiredoxin